MNFNKTFSLLALIIFFTFSLINIAISNPTENAKKLNFKEYGPFFGIKKGRQWIRGIHVGVKDDYAQSTWYGTFAKDNLYHKGYWVHTYSDGKIIYQYSHFKLDKQGKVIKDEKGQFLIEDSYVISKEDFEKVKSYIQYDIELPFSFYNFDVNDKAETTNESKLLVSNNDFKNLKDIKKNLEIDGSPFTTSLENLETGEKNITVSIKKTKINFPMLDRRTVIFETKYSYTMSDSPADETYSIIEYEEFPDFKIQILKNGFTQVWKYTNAPKNFSLSKQTKSRNFFTADLTLASYNYLYSEENGYFKWDDLSLVGDGSLMSTVVKATVNKKGKAKKIIEGQCQKPSELFKIVHKDLVDNCDKALSAGFKVANELIYDVFDIAPITKLQENLIASLNKKKIKFDTDEKYYALVIGNNNYQYLEKLDAAENDAVVISDVLEKKYGFEVDLLLNADYDQTVNSLFKITDKLKRNDNLLIYYAGHGELDKAENRGYWLPVDASYEMRSKWISNQRIVDRIKATKAKHVLLVADSCFSGTLMRSGSNLDKDESIDEKYIKRLKNKKTRLVITSGGNEPVVDSVGGDHSLFALKFIDTLKNNNTVINSQILFENVRRYVVANADQTPERAMVHKTGHDGGDFLFFPKK
jgi:hypothetical protein